VRRITIVTAAFIVVYTLVTGISDSYNYDPGYYGELVIEDKEILGDKFVEEEEYQPGYLDMLCQGGKRHRYCP
jgi:hypothetical protein